MDCRQSLLSQLFSRPHEEALKILDDWRSSQQGHVVDTSSQVRLVRDGGKDNFGPPTYDQLFVPPQRKLCESGKLYGREYLKAHEPDQLRILNGNYRRIRQWFVSMEPLGDLRYNANERDKVKATIEEKYANDIKALVVHGEPFMWKKEDIYKWCLKSIQSKRKWKKSKATNCEHIGNISGKEDDDDGEEQLVNQGSLIEMLQPTLDDKLSCKNTSLSCKDVDAYYAEIPWIEEKDTRESCEFQTTLGDNLASKDISSFCEDVDAYYVEVPWVEKKETRVSCELKIGTKDEEVSKNLEEKDTCIVLENTLDASLEERSRKSSRKRKITSKAKELMAKKKKETKRTSKKNHEETSKDEDKDSSNESLELKARNLSRDDQETILMKWLSAKSIGETYQSLKSAYLAMRNVKGFYARRSSDLTTNIMREDLVAWLLRKKIVTINMGRNDSLSLSDVYITSLDDNV